MTGFTVFIVFVTLIFLTLGIVALAMLDSIQATLADIDIIIRQMRN